MIVSGTVSAGLGLRAATVPFVAADLVDFFPLEDWWVVEMVRFLASSVSIFLRIALDGDEQSRRRGYIARTSSLLDCFLRESATGKDEAGPEREDIPFKSASVL